MRTDGPVHLYRHFTGDGTLLYVGISLNAVARLAEHRRYGAWFSKIARIEIQQFPTWLEASRAEREAIRREGPKFNTQEHTMGRQPILDRAMTPAERQARSRHTQRARLVSNPEHFAKMVGYELGKLDLYEVDAVNADKALALIARDIAKRRKTLAPKLAEHRRKQRRMRRFMRTGELPR